MKKLTFWKSLFLLCALIVGSSSAWGQTAAVDDVLWTEPFKGTNTSTSFSETSSWGSYTNPTTFVASDASSLSYTSSNAMASSTSSTNMDGSHVWLNKSVNGYIQVTGIPLYNATKVKVSWAQATSGSSTTVYYQFDGTGDFQSLSTCSGPNANFVSDELSVANHTTIALKFSHPSSNSKNTRIDNLTLTVTAIAAPSGTTAAPSISGNTPFVGNTTVTINNAASADGADIFYTLNGDDPTTTTSATCFAYSAPFEISATTIVKAIAKKSTDTNASSAVSKTFTKVTPISVSDALTVISALPSNGTSADQCVRGIVCTEGTVSSGAITYYISDDGSTTNRLQVYKGKGLYNADFEADGDIAEGDEVVVYGTLKNFSGTTPEFDQGSYLLSKATKATPTFSLDITEKSLDAYTHETVDVELTTNTDGVITCKSSNDDVATVALKSGKVYTITAQTAGTATITISSEASANYKAASAEVAITVTDTRAEAGISFTEAAVETTWGEEFTGQELTNTHTLAVDWSSTDETVATVNASGVVTVLKAGTTDIKATFAGNATYKAAIASYSLTVNKANAGLSYATTNYNVDLFDNSFVAPALTNPNGLTVTYASDKTAVAEVNETTGAVTLHTNAAGKATITASFVGNDNFSAGNASYTINVVDPSVVVLDYNNNVFGITDSYVQEATLEYTANGITLTLKQDGTETKPRIDGAAYTSADKVVRIYSNSNGSNTMKVTAPAGSVITKIVFDFNKGSITENNNTYSQDNTTWEGDAANVTFTAAAATFINKMTITLAPTVVVTDAKYASYVTTAATDFANTEGVTAYKVTAANATTITMETIDVAPKGTPVILKAVAETYTLKSATSAPAEITDNLLKAGPVTGDGASYYVLGKDGEGNLGFGLLKSGVELPATKAYLPVSAVGARVAFIPFDSETTAIDFVIAEPIDANAPMYNLAGQRVNKSYKGVVIVNGKKMLNK